MKLTLSKSELTCVSLEKELGLARGDIRELNIEPDGTIEFDVAKNLTSAQKTKLEFRTGLKIQQLEDIQIF